MAMRRWAPPIFDIRTVGVSDVGSTHQGRETRNQEPKGLTDAATNGDVDAP